MDPEPTPQVSAPTSNNNAELEDINDRPAKRVKMEEPNENKETQNGAVKDEGKARDDRDSKKGQAPIKAE
jgi:hypothetical protein